MRSWPVTLWDRKLTIDLPLQEPAAPAAEEDDSAAREAEEAERRRQQEEEEERRRQQEEERRRQQEEQRRREEERREEERKRKVSRQRMCWLLFRYPFHPCVTAIARKRSRSFCQKCRWQVTAKHTYILHMWLCMKWHGAWSYGVHRTCTEMAAVSCGTSHACAGSTSLQWIFKKRAIKS